MHFVIITNLVLNKKFVGKFDTKRECDEWVSSHKLKGKDRVIIRSDKKLNGFEVLLEDRDSNGNIEYVLEGASEYKVDYLSHDPFEAVNHWNDFRNRKLELLRETDWSQISDAEISTEERRIYKEYRKYIRRKDKEYNDETIENWKILSYKEYVRMKYPK